jgi:L-lactate utilization protein LutB
VSGIDLAEQFRAALTALDGVAHLCTSAAEAHDRVVDLCAAASVVIDEGHPDTAGLAERLALVDDPWEAAVGVTGVDVAVAETGTLVLSWGPGRRRSTPLVPPVHVALVPLHRLVATYADAIDVLAAMNPAPSGMQLVTGPSQSADIEMKLVKGVHGPGQVHVVLYPQPDRACT